MYYVQVLKNNRVIGRLRRGKVDVYGSTYPHPANAKRAVLSLLRKFSSDIFECQIRDYRDNYLHTTIRAADVSSKDGMTPLQAAAFEFGRKWMTGKGEGITEARKELEKQAQLFYGRRR